MGQVIAKIVKTFYKFRSINAIYRQYCKVYIKNLRSMNTKRRNSKKFECIERDLMRTGRHKRQLLLDHNQSGHQQVCWMLLDVVRSCSGGRRVRS